MQEELLEEADEARQTHSTVEHAKANRTDIVKRTQHGSNVLCWHDTMLGSLIDRAVIIPSRKTRSGHVTPAVEATAQTTVQQLPPVI